MKFLWLFLAVVIHGCACPGLAWTQASSKVVQVDQASGVSSTPNYWKTGDAEFGLAGVSTYNDGDVAKPVDCTGGTADRLSVAKVSPALYDKQSWYITKTAFAARGQGVAFEFDVDNGIAAVEMMDLMFEYMTGDGVFGAGSDTTDSDLMVYVYDVTAGKLIEPKGGSKLYTSSTNVKGDYRGWFQSTLGSKKYRVCLHQATSSAAYYRLKVDAGKVQKSKQVVGTIITDWESYAPTIIGGAGSIASSISARKRRVGDSEDYKITYVYTSGTGASANFELSLANTINTAKLPTTSVVGSGYYFSTASGFKGTEVRTSGSNGIIFTKDSVGAFIQGTDADEAGSAISVNLTVPIVGWSAGARMSDGYDGVSQSVSVAGTATGTIAATFASSTSIIFPTVILNKTGIYTASNGETLIKSTGDYSFTGNMGVTLGTTASTNYVDIALYVNGSLRRTVPNSFTISTGTFNASFPFEFKESLNAGDVVTFRVQSGFATKTPYVSLLSITKDSGTPFMSPTVSSVVIATNASMQSIPNGTLTTVTGWTKSEDTFDEFNSSTGIFTPKSAGFYVFSGILTFAAHSPSAINAEYNYSINNNSMSILFAETTAASFKSVSGSTIMYLGAGQAVAVRVFQNSGASRSLYSNPDMTKISIVKMK